MHNLDMAKKERLIFSELPQETRDRLNEIMSHDPSSLTADEQSFLRARRGYLNADDRATFKEVLDGKAEPVTSAPKRNAEEAEAKADEAPVEEPKVRQISKTDFTRDALVSMCKDAGLPVDDADTKQVLVERLNAHFEVNNVLA